MFGVLVGIVVVLALLMVLTIAKIGVYSTMANRPLEEINAIFRRKDIEVVISRFEEPLDWLLQQPYRHFLPNIVLYNKGSSPIPREIASAVKAVVPLENLGRCDHTYLAHVVRGLKEGTLAGTTVFLTASTYDLPNKRYMARRIFQSLWNPTIIRPVLEHTVLYDAFRTFQMDRHPTAHEGNRRANPETALTPSAIRPFGPWIVDLYESVFGPGCGVRTMKSPVFLYGVFVGTRENIQKTPLALYERLLKEVAVSSNPEVGHYIERLWGTLMFGVLPEAPTPGHAPVGVASTSSTSTSGLMA
jgi:hypothetical protein